MMLAVRQNAGKIGGSRRSSRASALRRMVSPLISMACVAASALLAPTMVRAIDTAGESVPVSLAARGALGSFTPATVDRRLVAQASLTALSHGRLFRFTPAGMDSRPDRAITVAVRLPDAHSRLINGHPAAVEPGTGFAAMRIAPVAYNLGTARGYRSFALPTASVIHDPSLDSSELKTFSLAPSSAEPIDHSPRLSPNVAFDEHVVPGRAPRTLGAQGDYQLDMGGSYRLGRNLDVTAGVRYSSDRERLRPLTDHRQDSQAIYVGTQFKF